MLEEYLRAFPADPELPGKVICKKQLGAHSPAPWSKSSTELVNLIQLVPSYRVACRDLLADVVLAYYTGGHLSACRQTCAVDCNSYLRLVGWLAAMGTE